MLNPSNYVTLFLFLSETVTGLFRIDMLIYLNLNPIPIDILRSRRIYRGAVNQFLFRHSPSKIFWKCTIWNINIQYENGWYTLQKLTKPVFAFRQWENLVSSSINPFCLRFKGKTTGKTTGVHQIGTHLRGIGLKNQHSLSKNYVSIINVIVIFFFNLHVTSLLQINLADWCWILT